MRKNKLAWRIFVVAQILLLLTVALTASAQYSPKVAMLVQKLLLGTTWTYTLDTTRPQGTEAPSVLDNFIRDDKSAFGERLNVDHIFAETGSQFSDPDTGYHRNIHFFSSTNADPILGVTTVDGVDELRYTDSGGTTLTLTSVGTLNIASADLLGTLENNTYFSAVDNAGTGTVDLIKANASDVAVIPDGSETATSAAPTADADIANKKYVDDEIEAVAVLAASGSTVFNGTMSVGGNFQDLDLSGTVGSTSALVILEVTSTGSDMYAAKQKGANGTYPQRAPGAASGFGTGLIDFEANNYGEVIILTDSAGVIQHGYQNIADTIVVRVLGYIAK